MKTTPSKDSATVARTKSPTGVAGFAAMTGGGVPRSRTTLVMGGPGSGKTIRPPVPGRGRQVRRARHLRGIRKIRRPNRRQRRRIRLGLDKVHANEVFSLDAQPTPDLVQLGDFDLGGLIATIDAKAKKMGAGRIVLDALDILLAMLPDAAAQLREAVAQIGYRHPCFGVGPCLMSRKQRTM